MSSSHVYTNSESMKPEYFPQNMPFFWSVQNGFSFENQNRLQNVNRTVIF
jgi:hypothetical protein